MATSATLALITLQSMALDATYRALLAPPKAHAWMADQKEVLEQLAADRAQITEEDLRQQYEDNECEQLSNDMQTARGDE